jgi:hypothetical protein
MGAKIGTQAFGGAKISTHDARSKFFACFGVTILLCIDFYL